LIVTFEVIEDLSHGNVQFYTARFGQKELAEFQLFDEKDFPKEEHQRELEIIYGVINEIINRGAAKKFFFKDERGANALPKVPQELMDANKKDYGIRLYCIRLTDELVILLNGDVKTHLDPQQCPNVKNHFSDAVNLARKLDRAIANREINVQQSNPFEDFETEI
jgi:hypothetical protein